MVFIQFVFFTLCTLIHKDANNTAHIMFRSALVFPGTHNIYHALSRAQLPERDVTFSERQSFKKDCIRQ